MTHVHLIGIGGTGISSIARVLLEKGYTVSGSDRVLSPLALDLRAAGVTVYEGHSAGNIAGADLVVRSSAIPDENVEVIAACEKNIPVLKRSDFLGDLLKDHFSIAVAGSHGKTTTSSLLAWSLHRLSLDPSYILGGVSKNLGSNAHAGKGRHFVIEADEYDRMFLGLNPDVILINNIEFDHPDCFPTLADYTKAFTDFIRLVKPGGFVFAGYETSIGKNLFAALPAGVQAFTFGKNSTADYRAANLKINSAGSYDFDVFYRQEIKPLVSVSLLIPGEHNVLNALGVIAIHHQLGTNLTLAALAIGEFNGTGRRFDVVGEVNGITIVDDYAHHPSKIRATLAAARTAYPKRRIIAVWQPHTYSRTRALASEFINAFVQADLVIVSEIYASREKVENYSSRELVQKMHPTRTRYIHSIPAISDYLIDHLVTGDVLIVLSAGDADQVCKQVFDRLSERKNKNG
jgi:UDP-N-acetylmuramate--alanine ligase